MNKQIYGRFCQKHDIEANWLQAKNFAPLAGELIIYDADGNYNYPRFKVGIWDGESEKTDDMLVSNLPFAIPTTEEIIHSNSQLLSEILETYIFNIDYDTLLAFDTTEIVIGATSATSVLGQAILGQMVLA